jgi:hypothetical protein
MFVVSGGVHAPPSESLYRPPTNHTRGISTLFLHANDFSGASRWSTQPFAPSPNVSMT